MQKSYGGLGYRDLVAVVQWRKLGVFYHIVQRAMPSQAAGEALLERNFKHEAVTIHSRQSTLDEPPWNGLWTSSLRQFLFRENIFLQDK